MSNEYGRRRGPGGPPRGGRRTGRQDSFDDGNDGEFDDADGFDDQPDEGDDAPPPRRRDGRRPGPARPPAGGGRRGPGLFGGGRPARRPAGSGRGGGFDWSAAEDDEGEDGGYRDDDTEVRRGHDEFEDEEPRPKRRAAGRAPRRRLSLMDLCTPVFGYAAILPREEGGIHPAYQQFRQEVVAALDRIEREAPDHGIEREDARQACYALALFLDEQVADSEWTGKAQWSSEPLNIVRLNDPEGGLHFFEHLEGLGNRQRAVKRIFLVCLALGFRGKYGELDPSQQVARLGEVRQKVLRTIQEPIETRPVLFPEAYTQAIPLEVEAPPPPRWWWLASLGATTLLLLLWLMLFYLAGRKPEPAEERLRAVDDRAEGLR